MGIKFRCPNGHKLNVKSFLAGKRGICPHCGEKFVIPVEALPAAGGSIVPGVEAVPADDSSSLSKLLPVAATESAVSTDEQVGASEIPPSNAGESPSTIHESPVWATEESFTDPFDQAPDASWYVRPAAGGQFGPAIGDVMRTWLQEGRVGDDSMVWREGWDEWKDAGQVFPHLQQTNTLSADKPTSSPTPPSTEIAAGVPRFDLREMPGDMALSRAKQPTGRTSKFKISLFIVITLLMAIIGLVPILLYVAIWH